MNEIVVHGYKFNQNQSYALIKNVISKTHITEPNDVQDYLVSNYTVEENESSIVLRNKDFNGLHFSLSKEWL